MGQNKLSKPERVVRTILPSTDNCVILSKRNKMRNYKTLQKKNINMVHNILFPKSSCNFETMIQAKHKLNHQILLKNQYTKHHTSKTIKEYPPILQHWNYFFLKP